MNDQYPIGTVCIGQNFVNETQFNNRECEIIGGLEMRWGKQYCGRKNHSLKYAVRWADGSKAVVDPRNLRRKQSDSQWADEAIRKLKKQSSDHVAGGKPELIPEESVQ